MGLAEPAGGRDGGTQQTECRIRCSSLLWRVRRNRMGCVLANVAENVSAAGCLELFFFSAVDVDALFRVSFPAL